MAESRQQCRQQRAKSRWAPLTLDEALGKAFKTFADLRKCCMILPKDETRIRTAFASIPNKKDNGRYASFLRHAKRTGGCALVLLCVLALGKVAVKNLKNEVRCALLSRLLKKNYHQSGVLKQLASEYLEEGTQKPDRRKCFQY